MTGSGTVTSVTQDITGVSVTSLADGTLTYSVTLTDSHGNTGNAALATALLDKTAPSGYTITADFPIINAANAANTGFTFAGATIGTTYSYTVTSSNGSGSVTGNGAVTSVTQDITGIDVTSLTDGTLTYSVTLDRLHGNTGNAATATALLDTSARAATRSRPITRSSTPPTPPIRASRSPTPRSARRTPLPSPAATTPTP